MVVFVVRARVCDVHSLASLTLIRLTLSSWDNKSSQFSISSVLIIPKRVTPTVQMHTISRPAIDEPVRNLHESTRGRGICCLQNDL